MTPCRDPRHEAFAQAYVANGYNRAVACRESGLRSGHTTYHHPDVQRRIQELVAQNMAANEITAQRVMTELGRIAFGDMRDIFDAEGNLLPVQQWDADAAGRVSAIDVETRWEGRGDNAEPVTIKKIRTYDKMAALGLLAKHFKLVGDDGDGVNALASALADRLRNARRQRQAPVDEVVDVEPVEPGAPRPIDAQAVEVLELPAGPVVEAAVVNQQPEEPLW